MKLRTKIKEFFRPSWEFWVSQAKSWKRGFVVGMFVMLSWIILIRTLLESLFFIGDIFLILSNGVAYFIARLLGIEPERMLNWLDVINNSDAPANETMGEGLSIFEDMWLTFANMFFFIPGILYKTFAFSFPILNDIKIDIDWLHVSLSYVVRTFFNLAQFAVMFYVTRNIRFRIKTKVKEKIESPKG